MKKVQLSASLEGIFIKDENSYLLILMLPPHTSIPAVYYGTLSMI